MARDPDYAVVDGRLIARTVGLACAAVGCSEKTLRTWIGKGCPGEKGRYDVPAVIEWARRNPWLPLPPDADPLLGGGDSPGLERYRLAKAELAEFEVAERRGQVVRVEAIRDLLTAFTSLFRQAGETVSRRFGREAHKIVDEACDEGERLVAGIASPGGPS